MCSLLNGGWSVPRLLPGVVFHWLAAAAALQAVIKRLMTVSLCTGKV